MAYEHENYWGYWRNDEFKWNLTFLSFTELERGFWVPFWIYWALHKMKSFYHTENISNPSKWFALCIKSYISQRNVFHFALNGLVNIQLDKLHRAVSFLCSHQHHALSCHVISYRLKQWMKNYHSWSVNENVESWRKIFKTMKLPLAV
jgi:hypothetical protein